MSDIWSWNNAVDAAGTLLSSTVGSAGDLLVSNLRDPAVGMPWRAGATAATLNITLPASGAISLFGLFGLNYADIGDVTLKLGTSEGAGDLWEETFTPTGRRAVFVLRDAIGALAPVSASHATISVAAGAPLEIGRVWLGTADWQSTRGHGYDGSGWGGQDLSRKSRTPRSGTVLGDRGAVLRTFTVNYEMLDESEYAGSLFEMDDQGTLRQMLCIPISSVYDPHRFAILGTLDEIPNTAWRFFATAGRSITITESG